MGILAVALLLGRCGIRLSLRCSIWRRSWDSNGRSRKSQKGVCVLHGTKLKDVWLGESLKVAADASTFEVVA